MKRAGRVVVTAFPHTDLTSAKLRPVLVLWQASSRFDDWLVCMVSSRLEQAEPGFDDIIGPGDADFAASGLKAPSAFRLKRIAVLTGSVLLGSIGAIGEERLNRMRQRLAGWIAGAEGCE